jgi:hypothetical protein
MDEDRTDLAGKRVELIREFLTCTAAAGKVRRDDMTLFCKQRD